MKTHEINDRKKNKIKRKSTTIFKQTQNQNDIQTQKHRIYKKKLIYLA